MLCYCSGCFPSEDWGQKTVKKHLKLDEIEFLKCSDTNTTLKSHLRACIDKTRKSLGSCEPLEAAVQHETASNSFKETEHASLELQPEMIVDEDGAVAGSTAFVDVDSLTVNGEINGSDSAVNTAPDDLNDSDDMFGHIAIDIVPDDYDPEQDPLSQQWWGEPGDKISEEREQSSGGSSTADNIDSDYDEVDEEFLDEPTQNVWTSPEDEDFLRVPESLESLRKELTGRYRRPEAPPERPPHHRSLSLSEIFSLQHYAAWVKTNGTIEAYNKHGEVLAGASQTDILSLYEVKKLAESLVDFKPRFVDMCLRSCIAYTGKYKELEACPRFVTGKGLNRICDEPRYHPHSVSSRTLKPRAQFQSLSIMARIRGLYANATTARLMRDRDEHLQQALLLMSTAVDRQKRTYSDYGNGQVHIMQHQELGLFQDSRDVALALSTDGAQLTLKKQSNTWLAIFIFLNLPADIRYQTAATFISFATPGPNAPGDMESFLWPIFEEMMQASEGIWTWDAVDSSYFCLRACISMVLGDMLGSAKLNGMAGHTALHGDRFSLVRAAKCAGKGPKSLYYPMNPPDKELHNPTRPTYDLSNLPMRTQQAYWKIIESLEKARTKTERAKITTRTGVVKLPLCAASPAFFHPTFFPIDPFHIFYEDEVPYIWCIWIQSDEDDPIHLPAEKAQKLGQMVTAAMETLPPVFCGPVRDPYLKWQSQYKAYEWMALAHWYIVPMGIELGMNPRVLKNFSRYVQIMEFCMTISPRSLEDLVQLKVAVIEFLEEFERLYVGGDPKKVDRIRLCIFQLIHLPLHIQWNGSVRLGSQATVERSIGEMGHKIRSKKAPFANLANLIYQRELVRLLTLYYPEIDPSSGIRPPAPTPLVRKLFQKHRIPLTTSGLNSKPEILSEIELLSSKLFMDIHDPDTKFERYGKLRLSNGHVLASRSAFANSKSVRRRSEWFEGICSSTSSVDSGRKPGTLFFGNAHAFYRVKTATELHTVVVYTPLHKQSTPLNTLRGEWNEGVLEIADIREIQALVGIWTGCTTQKIYILRKHPALATMSEEDRGLPEDGQGGQPSEDLSDAVNV